MKKVPNDRWEDPERVGILDPLWELIPLKAVFTILGAAVLLVGGYFFSLYAIHGFDPDFLQINECVESGGRWNSKLRICEKLPGIYEAPPPQPAF
jgi:hypothetical protein